MSKVSSRSQRVKSISGGASASLGAAKTKEAPAKPAEKKSEGASGSVGARREVNHREKTDARRRVASAEGGARVALEGKVGSGEGVTMKKSASFNPAEHIKTFAHQEGGDGIAPTAKEVAQGDFENDAINERVKREAAEDKKLDDKISQLGDGDSYEVTSKGGGSIKVPNRVLNLGVEGERQVTVKKEIDKKTGKPRYIVKSSTELAGTAGASGGDVSVGGKKAGQITREYEFDNAEDARKAATLLNGRSPRSVGEGADKLLKDNLKSETFTGKEAAQIAARAPLGEHIGMNRELKGETSTSVTINYEKGPNGPKAKSVTIGNKLTGSDTGKADLDFKIGKVGVTINGGDASKRTIELENKTTIPLPEGTDPNAGTLGKIVEAAKGTKVESSVKVTSEQRRLDTEPGENLKMDVVEYELKTTNKPEPGENSVSLTETRSQKRGNVGGVDVDVGVGSVNTEHSEIVVDEQSKDVVF